MTEETLSRAEIDKRAKEVIRKHLKLGQDGKIENHFHFEDDLGVSSFDMVDLLFEIEDEFDVEILDDELEQTVIFEGLMDLVEKKVNL